MNIGNIVRLRPRDKRDRRAPFTGHICAIEEGGRNPVMSFDDDSCQRLGVLSATVTCNSKRLEVIEEPEL